MSIHKPPSVKSIKELLGQNMEMVSGLNLQRFDPVTEGMRLYPVLPSREHLPVPSRMIRFDGQSFTKPLVEMTFSFKKLNKALRRTKPQMEKLQYAMRVRQAFVDDAMWAGIIGQKGNRAEVLATVGSSIKIDRLIQSPDRRQRKRGWRLYKRNQK